MCKFISLYQCEFNQQLDSQYYTNKTTSTHILTHLDVGTYIREREGGMLLTDKVQ